MIIYPAIDLLGGNVVRLHQGRYEEATIYETDPLAAARRFREHVATLHVVDLDGAKAGCAIQRELIQSIVESFGGAVQVGGGVRTQGAFESYIALGAQRVILGTAAVMQRDLVVGLAREFPGRVVIAVDAKDGKVATDGWTAVSSLTATDLVQALRDAPVAAILYTDIARDGTGVGPNLEATAALAAASPFPVIASGGIATEAHIRALARIPNVESAIVGRALYDGSLTLEQAVAAAER